MIHVVLTRAEGDAKRQQDLLSNRGFAATALPLLAIEPVATASVVEAELAHANLVIFTSANAVTHGLSYVSTACLRTSTRVLAVGRKTREILHDQGIEANSPHREDSEGLLELIQHVSGGQSAESNKPARVVVVKGEGGRDLLTAVLADEGCHVTEVNCYRRVWPPVSQEAFVRAFESGQRRYIHIASGETLSRLQELCDRYQVDACTKHTLVLPSDRVDRQARELGWQSRIVAAGASDDALLDALSTLS